MKEEPELFYIKKPNGRYEHVGYNRIPDIYPGLWLIRKKEHGSTSYTNLFHRLDDVPDFCEVKDMIKCTMLADLISEEFVDWDKSNGARSYHDAATHIATAVYKRLQKDRADCKRFDKYLED